MAITWESVCRVSRGIVVLRSSSHRPIFGLWRHFRPKKTSRAVETALTATFSLTADHLFFCYRQLTKWRHTSWNCEEKKSPSGNRIFGRKFEWPRVCLSIFSAENKMKQVSFFFRPKIILGLYMHLSMIKPHFLSLYLCRSLLHYHNSRVSCHIRELRVESFLKRKMR